ncbi:hypothetical protein [Phytohabitans suffuscus]|uniref:hypothetical protein n=1 Tax=Phytohabitans suffuscus TaxID=624315 RepID=UPI001566EB64|nr:hypothetical protein [Phytohabitans suffuscus]
MADLRGDHPPGRDVGAAEAVGVAGDPVVQAERLQRQDGLGAAGEVPGDALVPVGAGHVRTHVRLEQLVHGVGLVHGDAAVRRGAADRPDQVRVRLLVAVGGDEAQHPVRPRLCRRLRVLTHPFTADARRTPSDARRSPINI